MKKFITTLSYVLFVCFLAVFISPSPAIAKTNPKDLSITYQCDAKRLLPADDYSQRVKLPYQISMGGQTYSSIFVSPNGFITFNWFDNSTSQFPNSPNISALVYDWVTVGEGTYISYGTTSNTLCITWNVKPYSKLSQAPTQITLKILLNNKEDWSGYVSTSGWIPDTVLRGIRPNMSSSVTKFSSLFNIGANGTPEETKECWNKEIVPTSDSCEPTPPPIAKVKKITCTGYEPVTGGQVTWDADFKYNEYWDGHTEDVDNQTNVCNTTDKNLENVDAIVTLDNGVELTFTVAQALKVFDSPSAVVKAIFTDPTKFIKAISNVGADLAPETRKKVQTALVPAVIVTQIISTTSAITLLKK